MNYTAQDYIGYAMQDGSYFPFCPIGFQGKHEWEQKVFSNYMNVPIWKDKCKQCGAWWYVSLNSQGGNG